MKICCPFKRGRPIDETSRDRILDAAAHLFMCQGFQATSMDDIARDAGMSKLTLYRRFKDKNELFVSVIERKCHQFVPDEIFDVADDETAREALIKIGRAFFGLLLSDDALAMQRMMSAEAVTNPKLTELFYKAGPKRIKTLIGKTFMNLIESSRLNIRNPEEEIPMFLALFKGSDIYMKAVLNIGSKPKKHDVEAYILSAVDFFLKR